MKPLLLRIDQKSHAEFHLAGQRNGGDTWAQHASPAQPHCPLEINRELFILISETKWMGKK